MKLKKILVALMSLALLMTVPMFGLAEEATGSAAVTEGTTYTLEQMLTYAIQDEYAAQAEYEAILAAYGEDNAFGNIVQAESTHIALLETLFETYGYTLPENTAAGSVTLPESLQAAYETGVTAEIANISMYENFLAQTDLPSDVTAAFTALQNASQSHLSAFEQNTEKNGTGMMDGNGNQNGSGNQEDTQNGNGNGNQSGMMNSYSTGEADGTGNQNGETGSTQQKNQRTDGMGMGQNRTNNSNNNSESCDDDCDQCAAQSGQQNGSNGQNDAT